MILSVLQQDHHSQFSQVVGRTLRNVTFCKEKYFRAQKKWQTKVSISAFWYVAGTPRQRDSLSHISGTTRRKHFHFRTEFHHRCSKPPGATCAGESSQKITSANGRQERETQHKCKTPPNLVFHSKHTIVEQHYGSSLFFFLKLRHSLFTQGNFTEALRQPSRFY